MDHADLYRLRAEDFARRWENHRRIEWQTNFQVYAGYAAIAVAYSYLRGGPNSALGAGAVAATLLLYSTTLYLSRRTQERLHFNAGMTRTYFRELHNIVGAPELNPPEDTREPRHQRWYAYGTQIVLTSATAIGLIIYELQTTWPQCVGANVLAAFSAVVLCALAISRWL
jgi:hypothetical protein